MRRAASNLMRGACLFEIRSPGTGEMAWHAWEKHFLSLFACEKASWQYRVATTVVGDCGTGLANMAVMRQRKPASPVEEPPQLPHSQVFFYSLGHVFNDLCAATWFSYLLPFLTFAVRLDSGQAGIVMFSGQIAVSAESQSALTIEVCARG